MTDAGRDTLSTASAHKMPEGWHLRFAASFLKFQIDLKVRPQETSAERRVARQVADGTPRNREGTT